MGSHRPVLGDLVAALAAGRRRVVDATVGYGGHTLRFRADGAEVLAIDRDPEAVAAARSRVGEVGVRWLPGRFADPTVLHEMAAFRPGFVLLDLGVSSPQLDEDERGFSFRPGVPLDMRMSRAGPTAAEILNRRPRAELERMFREYGDERRAGRLAREVARRRENHPFATSDDFVNAVRGALGARAGAGDFARLFQAVRIAVNDEFEQLRTALPAMRDALVPDGRIVAISYHSGEDRIVKQAFREWARDCICPPEQPTCTCRGRRLGELDPRRPTRPSAEEIAANPRARSAILRGFRCHGEPAR